MNWLQKLLRGLVEGAGRPVPRIDVHELESALARDDVPVLLDVRTDHEFRAGHLDGARHIPLAQLRQRLSELEPHQGREITVICRSGNRSLRAARLLAAEGFAARDVRGGMLAWQSAGLPVQGG